MALFWHKKWHKNDTKMTQIIKSVKPKRILSDIIIENERKKIMKLSNYLNFATWVIELEVEKKANKISTDFVHSSK